MFTIVYQNGKRVVFSKVDYLLFYLMKHFPKMQLRTFELIINWLNNDNDMLPFCWLPFYITKE